MRPLSALDIVHIWEWGQAQHPIDRALTILRVACPEFSPEQLVALPIGQRDAYLLACVHRLLVRCCTGEPPVHNAPSAWSFP